MNASLYIQYAVIGVLVLVSALATLRKLAPALSARVAGNAASMLDRPGRSGTLQAIGRWLRPKQASGNCGDGCSTCGSCDTGDAAEPTKGKSAVNEVQPLTFHVRKGQH